MSRRHHSRKRSCFYWLLAVCATSASAQAACYSTPSAAIDSINPGSLISPVLEGGYRITSIQYDPVLGQRWAVVASCDHPEWPVVALPAQAAKTREESFHAALVVHAGDIVRLWKQEEFLRIETAGVAEENGYPGKTIRVRLLHRSTDDPLVQQQLAGIVRGTGGCGDAAMRQLIQSGTRVQNVPMVSGWQHANHPDTGCATA